jgi:hypothetical protein
MLMIALSNEGFDAHHSDGTINVRDYLKEWGSGEIVVVSAAFSYLLPDIRTLAIGPVLEVPDNIDAIALENAINHALKMRSHMRVVC